MTGQTARRKGGPLTVLIVAGGTGGHVFPALAVARLLKEKGVGIAWLGTRQGLEARVVPGADIPLFFISITGLRGKGALTLLSAPFRLMTALAQSFKVLNRLRPSAVLGMGGFVTGPAGVAAWLLRRPVLVHEQNAVPGLTNRLLARLACRVMEAFPGSFPREVQAFHTGNPIREELITPGEPAVRFADRGGAFRLLVLGGSQGARALNEVVPGAVATLEDREKVVVWHQAGKHNQQRTLDGYTRNGVQARVVEFIGDMREAYCWADLVLCRAGAMTIAELAAVGVPSILVPFPYAVDDHQTRNARYLADADAAVLVPQEKLTAVFLAALLKDLAEARERLLKMAVAARRLALPDATRRVAELCLEAANG